MTAVNSYKGAATFDLSCPTGTCMQSMTTYDGYGRVWTHKLPQQTSPTSYAYKPDDLVETVTDPRGVVATNSYNNRHLLTGVSYTGTASVRALAAVSFGYDATGNRTSMLDGTGTASYVYDPLSRVTSETRTFDLPNFNHSYAIGYGYSLSGALTSITDPSGAQVTYNYDSAGRLMSMPATGYSGVTNFLSNMQYRAWGAMKHATYGNSVQLNLSYNSRMLIGQYQLNSSNFNAGANMTYYDDGRTNTAFDLGDSRFDRKYEFDFSARLKEAYSGVEAHGAPPPPLNQANSPYRQTYSYDEYNNVTLRTGRIWSAQSEYDAQGYTNDNKHGGWTYDAAGNATFTGYGSDGGTRTYDAAGRPETFVSSQNWQVWPDWPSGHPDAPALETEDTFDATGQVVKHIHHTRHDETYDSGGGNIVYWMSDTATTTYYLHSTVLGGKMIVELDQNGVKTKGYVYSGGARVATQTVYGNSDAVQLEATNPVTGAAISTDVNGAYAGRQEPDPLGRDLTEEIAAPVVQDPIANSKWNEPMPIEASWGPSQEYLDANAAWDATMAQQTWMYQTDYLQHKADFINALINLVFTGNNDYLVQAQQILAKNPNFVIEIDGKMTAGQVAADAFTTALANLPGNPLGVALLETQIAHSQTKRNHAVAEKVARKNTVCPPNFWGIIAGGRAVTNAFNEAFHLAQKTLVEHGGWVVMDKRGKLRSVLKDREREDTRLSVQLGYPERHVRFRTGEVIVATFHAHVDDYGPDDGAGGDIDINTNRDRVPGIIMRESQVQGYGPKRGLWRQDLPQGCQ